MFARDIFTCTARAVPYGQLFSKTPNLVWDSNVCKGRKRAHKAELPGKREKCRKVIPFYMFSTCLNLALPIS